MGFFSEIASEARRGVTCNQLPTPAAMPVPAPEKPAESAPIPAVPASKSAPVPADALVKLKQEPEPLEIDLSGDAGAEDEAKRKRNHEAAEAKRKAEWDAAQERKRAAEQEQLGRIAAMDDEAAIAAAVKRAADATYRMTNRSMKESVSARIQELCRADPSFARLTMRPRKSMLHCIQYIFRQAKDYLEKELKAGGIKVSGAYGGDVPDGLVLSWAEKYYRDPDVKEDHQDEEKFIPKPYVPSSRKAPKAASAKKKPAAEKPKAPARAPEQVSLF